MKPIYRNSIIALLIIAAYLAGYKSAYTLGYYTATIRARNERYELIKRVRELEEREKSGTSSDTNTEKPPTSR